MTQDEVELYAGRIQQVFHLDSATALAAAQKMIDQPPHLLDEALCATATGAGDSLDAISTAVEKGELSQEQALKSRTTLVVLKVVRALRAVGALRDFEFIDDDDDAAAQAIGDEPNPDPEAQKRAELEFILLRAGYPDHSRRLGRGGMRALTGG